MSAAVDGLLRLKEAARELLEVANLRGDNDLPHPADDPKLWTARMAEAWAELEAAVDQMDFLEAWHGGIDAILAQEPGA